MGIADLDADPVFVFDGVFVGLAVLEELMVERAVREAVRLILAVLVPV